MLKSAWSRLFARALLAGAAVFLSTLQASDDPLGKATLLAAATAAAWAAIEILTPVNRLIGTGSGA